MREPQLWEFRLLLGFSHSSIGRLIPGAIESKYKDSPRVHYHYHDSIFTKVSPFLPLFALLAATRNNILSSAHFSARSLDSFFIFVRKLLFYVIELESFLLFYILLFAHLIFSASDGNLFSLLFSVVEAFFSAVAKSGNSRCSGSCRLSLAFWCFNKVGENSWMGRTGGGICGISLLRRWSMTSRHQWLWNELFVDFEVQAGRVSRNLIVTKSRTNWKNLSSRVSSLASFSLVLSEKNSSLPLFTCALCSTLKRFNSFFFSLSRLLCNEDDGKESKRVWSSWSPAELASRDREVEQKTISRKSYKIYETNVDGSTSDATSQFTNVSPTFKLIHCRDTNTKFTIDRVPRKSHS